jgi:GntR family transcriptional regulator
MQKKLDEGIRTQVRKQVLDLIGRMNLSYSTRLLSENQLAAKFKVSRTTVRAVLAELEAEGKITRRHGSGTYVNPAVLPVVSTLYPQLSTFEMIRNNGFVPRAKILSSSDVIAGWRGPKLNLSPTAYITEKRAVYFADDKPCMYCVDYYEPGMIRGLDWKPREEKMGSFYDFIREGTGVEIRGDIVRVVAADTKSVPELREWFCKPGKPDRPVVCLEIINLDKNNCPVIFGMIYVDAEIIQLNIIRNLGTT